MRKIIKRQPAVTLLLLLGLSLQVWQTAVTQKPGPTPPLSGSLTGGEAVLAQAINLLAKGTVEAAEAALEKCEEARKIFKETGDTKNEARALFLMGILNRNLGNKRAALRHLEQSLPLLEKRKDKEAEVTTRSYIGAVYAELGEARRAVAEYTIALQLARELDDKVDEAKVLFSLGNLYEELGERQRALDHLKQALSAYKALGDKKREEETLRYIHRLQ